MTLVLKCKITIFYHCLIGKDTEDKLQNSVYVMKTLAINKFKIQVWKSILQTGKKIVILLKLEFKKILSETF